MKPLYHELEDLPYRLIDCNERVRAFMGIDVIGFIDDIDGFEFLIWAEVAV